MGTVVDQSSYIVLRHLRQLLLEDAFQTGQNNETFPAVIVVDNPKLDLAIALLRDGGLPLLVKCSRIFKELTPYYTPSLEKEQLLASPRLLV